MNARDRKKRAHTEADIKAAIAGGDNRPDDGSCGTWQPTVTLQQMVQRGLAARRLLRALKSGAR